MHNIRLYELYSAGSSFSNKTADYRGEIWGVAAVSVKQAHYFARNNVWADDSEKPLGVVWKYNKYQEPDTLLWTGEKKWGIPIRHTARQREITETMRTDIKRRLERQNLRE